MKLTTTFAFALSALPLFACATSTSTFFSDGGTEGGTSLKDGGAGDGASTSGPTTDCAAFCALAAEKGVGCDDTAACTTACKSGKKAAASADCASEWDALLTCGSGPGTGGKKPLITCSSAGKADIANCNSAKTALTDCLAGSTTTPGDSGPGPGSCTLDQPFDSNATCNTCAEQNCCTEWNTCVGSTDCTALLDCANNCPTGTAGTSCLNTCKSQHATGNTQIQAALACATNSCKTPCNL